MQGEPRTLAETGSTNVSIHTKAGTFEVFEVELNEMPVVVVTPKGARLRFATLADAARYVKAVR